MKKYEKPTLVKAARLQALTAQVSSKPPGNNSNGNNEGGSIN